VNAFIPLLHSLSLSPGWLAWCMGILITPTFPRDPSLALGPMASWSKLWGEESRKRIREQDPVAASSLDLCLKHHPQGTLEPRGPSPALEISFLHPSHESAQVRKIFFFLIKVH
jgi:hypothetical protein